MKILCILSVIIFHLPLTLYKDTIRRFQRMEKYNPDKALIYNQYNGNLSEISLSVILYFLSSLLFSLFPLIEGLEINWLIAIILNLGLAFYVIPFIGFIFYPSDMIFNKNTLKIIGSICIILGFILFTIGMSDIAE
ncbi:hypothetical protein ETU08_08255 [Apibacter muscae]|uniref:hypothetical protein n=1 Tax=Apibacter muscae TaxID=2509004 RepID=UPI0011AC1FEB|nr:hypothetical protein [Apibacter muscae]TWP28827.1 hypothetical protein ETU08_08255 [Apibacter muscae]